jgi:hypothetical protein
MADRIEEARLCPAVLARDFDAHQAELEEPGKNARIERARRVHGGDERRHALVGEAEHRVEEQTLVVVEDRERSRHVEGAG